MIPYHSANLPQVGARPMETCATPTGVVFAHDIMSSDTLPDQYDDAGAIYVDLPWSRGFGVFNKRAGVSDGRTYPQFVKQVDRLARWSDRPVLVVSSDAAAKLLTGKTYPIRLDRPGAGDVAAAVTVYNDLAPLERTSTKLIDRLCKTWITVGDFTCGYGTTVRAAISHGTGFVASDYSAEAIGYICANVGGWR